MSPVWSAPSSLASSIVKAGLSRVAEVNVIDRAPVSGDTMSHMLHMIPMAVATTRMNTILLRVKVVGGASVATGLWRHSQAARFKAGSNRQSEETDDETD
jgi:hypothetical protein